MPYANNKGADQPAHSRSLISVFVVRCLDSKIALVSISEISSLCLASLAAQAGLCLTRSQTPKTGFLVTRLVYFLCLQRQFFHFCHDQKLVLKSTNKTEDIHGSLQNCTHANNLYICFIRRGGFVKLKMEI